MIKPFSWQQPAVDQLTRILSRSRGAVDCSDVGTGKTYVALFTAQILRLPVAIMCPKSLIPTWKGACESLGIQPVYIVSYDKAVKGFEYGKWINSTIYKWLYEEPHLLICDEAHRLRHYKTRTCKMFESGANWGAKFKLLALSATLAENPIHFKALGRWLDLFPKGQFWPWAQQNGVVQDGFGWGFTKVPEFQEECLRRIHATLFPHKGVRIRVKDIKGFPEQVIEFFPVEISLQSQKRVEKEVRELKLKALEDKAFPIVEIIRARQTMELLKVDTFIEQAEDLIEEGSSVVIFLEFIQSINAVAEGLKKLKPLVITGEETDGEVRAASVQKFQNNEATIIILQSRVGGVGLSLHDLNGRPRVSLISPSYSATTFKQVLGRIRRAGGKSVAIQRVIYIPTSIESRVIKAVKAKIANLDLLCDGDMSYLQ